MGANREGAAAAGSRIVDVLCHSSRVPTDTRALIPKGYYGFLR